MNASLLALCRTYAAHVGLPEPEGGFGAEAERRMSWWPVWARLGAPLIAAAVRWGAPLLLLGRPRRLDSLSADEKEAVFARLQQARWPLVRGAFLMVKTVVLGSCYGLRPS